MGEDNNINVPQKIVDQIEDSREILDYEEDWDEEGAQPADKEIYYVAINFIKRYASFIYSNYNKEMEEPYIDLSIDGKTHAAWHLNNSDLLIIFERKNQFCNYYFKDKVKGFEKNGKLSPEVIEKNFADILVLMIDNEKNGEIDDEEEGEEDENVAAQPQPGHPAPVEEELENSSSMQRETVEKDLGGPLISFDFLKNNLSPQLAQWLESISCKIDNYVQIVKKNGRLTVYLFTEEHKFSISVRLPIDDEGYLGCIMENRKERVGETWRRGSDLTDGKFCQQTFDKIIRDIVYIELKPLETNFSL